MCSFKIWHRSEYIDDWKHYKKTQTKAKRVVTNVKLKAYKNFYNELRSKEGEVKIYKLIKLRGKKSKDLEGTKCIKDDKDKALITNEDVWDRWKRYFCNFLNEMVTPMGGCEWWA